MLIRTALLFSFAWATVASIGCVRIHHMDHLRGVVREQDFAGTRGLVLELDSGAPLPPNPFPDSPGLVEQVMEYQPHPLLVHTWVDGAPPALLKRDQEMFDGLKVGERVEVTGYYGLTFVLEEATRQSPSVTPQGLDPSAPSAIAMPCISIRRVKVLSEVQTADTASN